MVNPEYRFVDFEVAYEGPVLTRHGDERPENFIAAPIDDLYICEECLRAGAKLIGMEGAEDIRYQLAQKNAEIEGLKVEIKDKDKAISNLSHTVGTVIDHPVKRPTGAPQLVGPAEKEPELKELRRSRAHGKKISKAKAKKKEPVA